MARPRGGAAGCAGRCRAWDCYPAGAAAGGAIGGQSVSVPVAVLPEARNDIVDGREFFEQCRSGLGTAFAVEVLGALDRIGRMPEMYGEISPGVRAGGIRRFGYVVYYRVGPGGVEVLAVLHGGRDPKLWQD